MSPQVQAKSRNLDIDQMIANAQEASEFLKALSHEARLVILRLLVEGEKSVAEIEQILSLRQPAVSQQLARLRADDLVRRGATARTSIIRSRARRCATSSKPSTQRSAGRGDRDDAPRIARPAPSR